MLPRSISTSPVLTTLDLFTRNCKMDDLINDTKIPHVLVGVLGFHALALMAARLVLRKRRRQDFNLSDYLTMAAIFCLVGRTVFATLILLWQNNNLSATFKATHIFTDREIYQRETGGKLTLVNRFGYHTYLWLQKGVVLLLYHRMFKGMQWPERIMKVYWGVLFATWVAVQVSCFVECKPFHLYWQVRPDPGECSAAIMQLYVLVGLNILTDLMLILLPLPWLYRIKRSYIKRAQLIGLFSTGFGLVIIAICRLPIYRSSASQVNRITLGSIEGFFAAFVANIPTLVTLRGKAAVPSSPKSKLATDGLELYCDRSRLIPTPVSDTFTFAKNIENARCNNSGMGRSENWHAGDRDSEDKWIETLTTPVPAFHIMR